MSKLQILLTDDHAVVREGLRLLIDSQSDMVVVGQAGTGEEALRLADETRPDVVVMDISMSGLDGAGATELIRRKHRQVRVLVLTRHSDNGYLQRMLRAGASGYLIKKTAPDQLVNAIRVVASGGLFFDPLLAVDAREGLAGLPSNSGGPDILSEREEAVLRLIAWGHSNKEIAGQLQISIKTVEYHKARAVEKLQLQSRTDIMRFALACGWLSSDGLPE